MTHASSTSTATATLADGAQMPQLGYGVWQVPDDEAERCVATAIEVGYRSIDTAAIYGNERGVGAGLRASGVARDELFVTTKLWNDRHTEARDALGESLELLGLDHVDLYLVHWPAPRYGETYREAWRTLLELRDEGLATSVGVCNFDEEHLRAIVADTGEVPALNQVECHPYFAQRELRRVHDELGIATEAWSPIGQGGELLADPVVVELANEVGATPAQVVLRWHLQRGHVTIPKSSTPSRIAENFELDGVCLDAAQLARLTALDRGDAGRIGPAPSTTRF